MSTLQTPLTILEIDPHTDPTPEQLQLVACDYVVRVLALMRQRRPRRALVRVTQLNALLQEFPVLAKAYPKLEVFVRFGAHFCSTSKVTATSMLLLGQKAAEVTQKMMASVSAYIKDAHLAETANPDFIALADAPKDQKLERLGIGLASLQTLMPRVLADEETRKAAEAEKYASRTRTASEVLSGDDLFILEQAGKVAIKELSADQSAIVRGSITLVNSYISRNTHRSICVDYGVHKVIGEYWIMTSALLVGIARMSEDGARGEDEMHEHAQRLLKERNKTRSRKGLDTLTMVGAPVYAGPHRYYLVMDSRFVTENSISIRRWSFFRRPGSDDVKFSTAT